MRTRVPGRACGCCAQFGRFGRADRRSSSIVDARWLTRERGHRMMALLPVHPIGIRRGAVAGARPAARAVPNVRIERLCWLAIRDQLARRGRVNPLLTVFRVGALAWVPLRGRVAGPDADWLGADPVSGRMRSFAFAVYDVARQLSAAERQELRRTGQVPDWFVPAVYRRRREMRHGRSQGL
jgi:hypothetical protein